MSATPVRMRTEQIARRLSATPGTPPEAGFTVFELLVVLAFSFIVLTTGFASISGTKRNLDTTEDTQALVSIFGQLRAEAIRTKGLVRITFRADGLDWDVFDDGTTDGSYAFHQTVSWNGATPAAIVFNGFGLIPAITTPRQLQLGTGYNTLKIEVNGNGHISLVS